MKKIVRNIGEEEEVVGGSQGGRTKMRIQSVIYREVSSSKDQAKEKGEKERHV